MNMTMWVLVVLLSGVGVAALTAWLRRRVTRRPEPIRHGRENPSSEIKAQVHDVMTTSDGTRVLLRNRKLVRPDPSEHGRRVRDA